MKLKILLGILAMGFNGQAALDPEGAPKPPSKLVSDWTTLLVNGQRWRRDVEVTAAQIAKFNLGPYGTLGDEWDEKNNCLKTVKNKKPE